MGFSQKFGPVLSYLRIAQEPRDINQVRIEKSSADALVGCDLVVSSSPKASATFRKGHTRALLNTAEMPTGDFVRSRDATLGAEQRIAAIRDVVGEHNLALLDANGIASRLMGDTIFANIIMAGAAWQRGLVPVSLDALLRAIELNGVRTEENTKAFQWGRIAAHDPDAISRLLNGDNNVVETLERMIDRRRAFLVDYQDSRLADRYAALVDKVRTAEPGIAEDALLTEAVANAYFRLLSYKDEYEVARLHARPEFLESLRAEYGENTRLRFHLAPPLLGGKLDARGRPRKREFGAWILPLFRVLARLRGLRGTAFDIFGYTAERRTERQLIREFEDVVDQVLGSLNADNRDQAVAAIDCFREIRGYGPVKEQAIDEVRAKVKEALETLQQPGAKAA
jgi:indolepyruvate ferredoxin oxidoreductase